MGSDQARQKAGPDLDLNCLTLIVFLKEYFDKFNFEKGQQTTKNCENLPIMQRVEAISISNLEHVLFFITMDSQAEWKTEDTDQLVFQMRQYPWSSFTHICVLK